MCWNNIAKYIKKVLIYIYTHVFISIYTYRERDIRIKKDHTSTAPAERMSLVIGGDIPKAST